MGLEATTDQRLWWIQEAFDTLLTVQNSQEFISSCIEEIRIQSTSIFDSQNDAQGPESLSGIPGLFSEALLGLRAEGLRDRYRSILNGLFMAQFASFERLYKHLLLLNGMRRSQIRSQILELIEEKVISDLSEELRNQHLDRVSKVKDLRTIRNFIAHEMGSPRFPGEDDSAIVELSKLKQAVQPFKLRLVPKRHVFTVPRTTYHIQLEPEFLRTSMEAQKRFILLISLALAGSSKENLFYIPLAYRASRKFSRLYSI